MAAILKCDVLPASIITTDALSRYKYISMGQQRGHLSAHASEGQCVEYASCEILAKLKIELSVNITKYQLI